MANCLVDRNSHEFQTLVQRSGLSEFVVEVYSRLFLADEAHPRYPNLDELPNVDSEPALRKLLELKDNNSCEVQRLLDRLGVSSTQEAQVKLNSEFTDKEVEITEGTQDAIVTVTPRPSIYNIGEILGVNMDTEVNDAVAFNQIFDKIQRLYGVEIVPITTLELQQPEFSDLGVLALNVKAFVHNGKIYLNTDIATIDSPVHEMLHILLGGLRVKNPKLYFDLVESAKNFENIEALAKGYEGRTQGDILEEVFVGQLAKYLIGQPSEIRGLSTQVQYELFYNMGRMLDSMLMGEITAHSIDNTELCSLSLKDIAQRVNSSAFTGDFKGTLDDATVHQTLGNIKKDLITNNQLTEDCE